MIYADREKTAIITQYKQGVDSYKTFYNQQRPHRTLKNKTPDQVEIEFILQQPDM